MSSLDRADERVHETESMPGNRSWEWLRAIAQFRSPIEEPDEEGKDSDHAQRTSPTVGPVKHGRKAIGNRDARSKGIEDRSTSKVGLGFVLQLVFEMKRERSTVMGSIAPSIFNTTNGNWCILGTMDCLPLKREIKTIAQQVRPGRVSVWFGAGGKCCRCCSAKVPRKDRQGK